RDASAREVFIAACFLVLIIGIGFYPKAAMGIYDAKTVAINAQVRESYAQIAQSNPGVYARGNVTPEIAKAEVAPVLGALK
ncbi:MAG: NAD(P)H-quinone oxidoreductase subunit 4, partial [Rivularia sp. (in: cyanobacteria)]